MRILGAPASDLNGPNFTPRFPAYPSGHAGFGGALFQTLRKFHGRDRIPFTFVSDEYNGVTRDNGQRAAAETAELQILVGSRRGKRPEPNLSRHSLAFDKTEGIAHARKFTDYVFDRAFNPLGR